MLKSVLFVVALSTPLLASPRETHVSARSFVLPIEQQIAFVPLIEIDPSQYAAADIPPTIDLTAFQSAVKNQEQRGACTYFATTSLIEGLIKQKTGIEIDLSEEYLAWSAKTLKNLRWYEEDSSVAVNAATLQDHGSMLEKDLPYQQSWFNKGQPCEGQTKNEKADPICFSHSGPKPEQRERFIPGNQFIFEAVDSRSIDIVRTMSRLKSPITVSILGHPETWRESTTAGKFILTPNRKMECQTKKVRCSGHAVLIVGYDVKKREFKIKNSWGTSWGRQGYGTISFDYIDQMSARKLITGSIDGDFELPPFAKP